MTTLTTRYVEYTRAVGQSEELDESSYFLPIALEREKRAVLQEIVGVEGRLPPLARFRQKKTGSRYAPKTASIAARISYSVQYARAQSRMNGIRF